MTINQKSEEEYAPVIRPATNTQTFHEARSVLEEEEYAPVIRPASNTQTFHQARSVLQQEENAPVIRPATNTQYNQQARSILRPALSFQKVAIIRPSTIEQDGAYE